MSSRVGYGQRRVEVTPEVLEAMLVTDDSVETDLPEDARLMAFWPPKSFDTKGTVTLLFESEAWDELEEGEEIPKIVPEVV